jgi:FtsP/CotA-like multicopper oxidase with cupredoxin domain
MTMPRSIAIPILISAFGAAPLAAVCEPGTVASPASFDGVIRPALAQDINPADDIVEVDLTAREVLWDFDVGQPTMIYSYNGVTPGPMIEANLGDTLVVNFCNDLVEPTTIHWHGVETPATMDGSNISQLAVPPGGTFRYEFPLLVAGTFWYHPHIRTNVQVEQGLYGALIVHDEDTDTLLDLPDLEHVFMLDDILIDPGTGQIVDSFAGTKGEVAVEQLDGREGNFQLFNGKFNPDLTMGRGRPHRIRMINTANARFMRMSIPDHLFYRIGGDQGLLEETITIQPAVPVPTAGTTPAQGAGSLRPIPTHVSDPDPTTGVLLTPGERADLLIFLQGDSGEIVRLEWHDTKRGRHVVTFAEECCDVTLTHDGPDGTLNALSFAAIELTGAELQTTYSPPTTLVELTPIDVAGAAALPLVMGHTIPDWNTGESVMFLQAPMKPFPALTPEDVHSVNANGTFIWEVKNLTGSHHNFHTHGFGFQHIETEYVDLDNPMNDRIEPATILENKDTFIIRSRPGGVRLRSWSITRFAVNFRDAGREGLLTATGKVPTDGKSGGWLAHCHLIDHPTIGMMTFFQIRDLFNDGFESGDTSAWPKTVP